MPTLLENMRARQAALGTEIAALTGTSDPNRKLALYSELAEIESRIARLEEPIEVEVRGTTTSKK